jgi:hypothetical protein
MNKPVLFLGQSNATIKLSTGKIDPVGGTVFRILYQKPNGTTFGFWSAVAGYKELKYDPLASDLNQEGWWKVQAFFVKDGKNHYGEIDSFFVKTPLSL